MHCLISHVHTQRLQHLHEADYVDEDLKDAIQAMEEAAQSKSGAQLTATLQDCVQALIDSSEKSNSSDIVRFRANTDEQGSVPQGERNND
jgi:hypothetical protein